MAKVEAVAELQVRPGFSSRIRDSGLKLTKFRALLGPETWFLFYVHKNIIKIT